MHLPTATELIEADLNSSHSFLRAREPSRHDREGDFIYDVHHPEHGRVGLLSLAVGVGGPGAPKGQDVKTAKIGVKVKSEHRGDIGLMNKVRRELSRKHPDITHVGGFRLTGTRDHKGASAKDSYTWVPLSEQYRSISLIEASLSEGVITHASNVDNISSILDTGALLALHGEDESRVSFSKYPQFSHYSKNVFLAFDRKKIEDHNNLSLEKPIHAAPLKSYTAKLVSKKINTNQDSEGSNERLLDVGGKKLRIVRDSTLGKINASGVAVEPFEYKAEREVTTSKRVNFKKEHIRYLGYHAVLHDRSSLSNTGENLAFIEHENQIKEVKELAAKHNLPVRLSVQLHPSHPDYNDFTTSGRSDRIDDFLQHVNRKGHSGLVSKAVVGLGTMHDTKRLSKHTHHSLKSTLTAEELIEASLSEGVITHSSHIDNISSILDANAFKLDNKLIDRVSFSKYPQYAHYGQGTFLAFDKKSLEAHNNSSFERPVYYDVAPSGVYKRGGKKFSTRSDSGDPSSFLDIGGKLRRTTKAPSGRGYDNDLFWKIRDSGRADEPFEYKPEREVTAVKGVKFKREHIRYLGYHAVLSPYTANTHDPERPEHSFINHEGQIKKVKELAAKHNLPVRLSVQLDSNHPKYDDFMATGRSNLIDNFLTHVRDKGHSDLASKAVVALGTMHDTPKLSKRTHPSLRSNMTAEEIIESKLNADSLGGFDPEGKHTVGEVNFDSVDGEGNTPNHKNINYLGFVHHMKPSEFLSLSSHRGDHESQEGLTSHIKSGGSIASPQLYVDYNSETGNFKVTNHEGRGRSKAVHSIQPDKDIPVHIIPTYDGMEMRSRHVNPSHLKSRLSPQSGATNPSYRFTPRVSTHDGGTVKNK